MTPPVIPSPSLYRPRRFASAVMPSFFLALLLQILAGYVLNILPTTGRLPAGMSFDADITGLPTPNKSVPRPIPSTRVWRTPRPRRPRAARICPADRTDRAG